eukprot:11086137-Heterocapsa_arctica.AAC.1
MKIGAWNVRRLGAPNAEMKQEVKLRCILHNAEEREWEAILLSDLWYGDEGTWEYTTEKQTWTIISKGLVGIAMGWRLSGAWREGGSLWWGGSVANQEEKDRALAVRIPKQGWRKGLHLVAAYAPTGDSENRAVKAKREKFREQLERVCQEAE